MHVAGFTVDDDDEEENGFPPLPYLSYAFPFSISFPPFLLSPLSLFFFSFVSFSPYDRGETTHRRKSFSSPYSVACRASTILDLSIERGRGTTNLRTRVFATEEKRKEEEEFFERRLNSFDYYFHHWLINPCSIHEQKIFFLEKSCLNTSIVSSYGIVDL